MSKLEIKYPPGATPLDQNELGGLIPTYITTQGELNTLERDNILAAASWALGRKHSDYLHVSFCFDLHQRMFKDVWKWAGKPRTTNKNIGVSKELIQQQLKLLFDDTKYWISNATYHHDEIAARFHHRLVSIHVFANGNGRHARMMTDIVLEQNGLQPFTWGSTDLQGSDAAARKEYIESLKVADRGDIARLLKFVRC